MTQSTYTVTITDKQGKTHVHSGFSAEEHESLQDIIRSVHEFTVLRLGGTWYFTDNIASINIQKVQTGLSEYDVTMKDYVHAYQSN